MRSPSKPLVLMLALLLAMATLHHSAEEEDFMLYDREQQDGIDHDTISSTNYSDEVPVPSSEKHVLGTGRRLLHGDGTRIKVTCDKYPTVCRAKGSGGKYCCKKKCVNVMTDRLNCGKCGKKCKYSEICCEGQCVNPSSDRRNCGCCGNKCKKGSFCVHGMCSYS